MMSYQELKIYLPSSTNLVNTGMAEHNFKCGGRGWGEKLHVCRGREYWGDGHITEFLLDSIKSLLDSEA